MGVFFRKEETMKTVYLLCLTSSMLRNLFMVKNEYNYVKAITELILIDKNIILK